MDPFIISTVIFALAAAGGWWAFANQKKANAAVASAQAVKSAVVDAVKKV